MRYDESWRPPWRTTEIAECKGPNCVQPGLPPKRVMACTLTDEGLCASCARTPENDDRRLPLVLGV